jgi:hypothetical protein
LHFKKGLATGHLKNSKKIVFITTRIIKGVGVISKLVSSREDSLPLIILGSDKAGDDFYNQIIIGHYREEQGKILGLALRRDLLHYLLVVELAGSSN